MVLLFCGLCPFVIGYLLNYILLAFNLYGVVSFVIGILFFLYWGFIGYISYNYVKSAISSFILGNSFAIIGLVLIIFQEVALKKYWPNIIGMAPQMFYLPTLSITYKIEQTFFFVPIHYIWVSYCLSFLLMALVYCWGYSINMQIIK